MKNYLVKQLYSVSAFPLLFIAVLWLVFFLQTQLPGQLLFLGISARDTSSLHGILTSVLVHGDAGHLASNSLPLLVLGMLLFYFYKKIAWQSFMWIWIVSGIWLWIGGRNNELHPVRHIGASTLVYGLAAFLFFSGVFRRHLRLMVVSALVVFLYGSIVWGMFPLKPEVSWEGHLFGALAGVLVAFNYRSEGPQRRVYQWEEDDDDENNDEEAADSTAEPNNADNSSNITVNYIYKPRDNGNEPQ